MNSARMAKPALMVLAALVLNFLAATGLQAQTATTLYDFATNGGVANQPSGVVAQGRDGNFYGFTTVPNRGTIYKMTPSGTFTLLHSMASDLSEGANCNGLILGTDGNFYGTCLYGGANSVGNGWGTIIKVTPAGALTVVHNFTGNNTGSTDGCYPRGVPVQASDGNLYGTTSGCGAANGGIAYKMTLAGVYTVIYPFNNGGYAPWGALIQGSDGNLWGTTSAAPTIFKLSTTGVYTVVYSLGCCGTPSQAGLVQGPDGNYYGTTEGIGANNQGEVFKVTPAGVLTVLHSFNNATEHGAYPVLPLTLGTDGNFYGVATDCAGGGCSPAGADLFEITSKGVFTDLYNFPNPGSNNDSVPESPLFLSTNGTFYSTTQEGGTGAVGTFYSLTNAQSAFIALQQTSGKVGSKIGILGQGFSASSVVKFNGVTATAVTRTGTTFLTATVPAGATDGFVTVTTGTTPLTSRGKFIVHNSWAAGTAMPIAAVAACSAVLNGQVYVVGGYNSSAQTAVQIYNPTTNKWSTGTALPSGLSNQACAAVNGEVYEFGGTPNTGGSQTNAVWAYNPTTKTWSSKSAMPTARQDIVAVVANNLVYVIGGYNGSRLSTLEAYNPATDSWSTEASLLTAESGAAAGLVGSSIVMSGGAGQSADTGDTESYSVSGNAWSALKADATVRNNACGGVVGAALYVAGGANRGGNAFTVNEAFTPAKNAWTTLAPLPQATADPASVVSGGQLFCFGGFNALGGTTLNNVQIYQP